MYEYGRPLMTIEEATEMRTHSLYHDAKPVKARRPTYFELALHMI